MISKPTGQGIKRLRQDTRLEKTKKGTKVRMRWKWRRQGKWRAGFRDNTEAINGKKEHTHTHNRQVSWGLKTRNEIAKKKTTTTTTMRGRSRKKATNSIVRRRNMRKEKMERMEIRKKKRWRRKSFEMSWKNLAQLEKCSTFWGTWRNLEKNSSNFNQIKPFNQKRRKLS